MIIKSITPGDLRHMQDQEALILQGCGGDLTEWVEGINGILAEEEILKDGFRFDDDDQYSDGKITFVTANNAPAPIMQKLSEMYPDITMRHQWADDNVGHNCGERVYKAGSVIEEFKPEPGVKAVDYACKIMGTTPADHCLKLNEDGTEYVCAEEEDMDETMEEGMHL